MVVLPSSQPKPSQRSQKNGSHHRARVIHNRRGNGKKVGKREDNNDEGDPENSDEVDGPHHEAGTEVLQGESGRSRK